MDTNILPWKPKWENQLQMVAQFSFWSSLVTMQLMDLVHPPLLANFSFVRLITKGYRRYGEVGRPID